MYVMTDGPCATAVTKPALVTVATSGEPLDHVPPDEGVRLVVVVGQRVFEPANTVGPGLTVNAEVVF